MMMPRPMPVQPPNDVIPPELRRKRLVERSDLRNERMTDADAREALSEYVVYRFEKVNDPNEIDDEGNPVKSTWENVIRTEVQDLSKPAITRTIRQLDAEGKTAMQKKLDLTGTQQRQIEKAQNNLDAHNLDRRFYYTLQQISTKIRKLSKDSIEYRQYMAGRKAKKVVITKYISNESRASARMQRPFSKRGNGRLNINNAYVINSGSTILIINYLHDSKVMSWRCDSSMKNFSDFTRNQWFYHLALRSRCRNLAKRKPTSKSSRQRRLERIGPYAEYIRHWVLGLRQT
ncbi:hypothetical protein COL516b_003085 [Colletotrichum fioriniae]|nr:uncharacterized protein COL516b_003085 [Colletotrichum fioriniae]KAJ0309187.1 hypothetical protein COL516b_003085 [Colletotrichum fioriniae]